MITRLRLHALPALGFVSLFLIGLLPAIAEANPRPLPFSYPYETLRGRMRHHPDAARDGSRRATGSHAAPADDACGSRAGTSPVPIALLELPPADPSSEHCRERVAGTRCRDEERARLGPEETELVLLYLVTMATQANEHASVPPAGPSAGRRP